VFNLTPFTKFLTEGNSKINNQLILDTPIESMPQLLPPEVIDLDAEYNQDHFTGR